MSFPKMVTNKLGKEVFQEAEASFQLTSSIKDALIAAGNPEEKNVTAMHDVTEGGVLGAIYELATAANCGAVIEEKLIPVGAVQAAVCQLFSLDPNHCIGAGAMLITCKKEQVEKIKNRLANENIDCTEIGQLTAADKGIKINKDGVRTPFPYQSEDPYWEAFFGAFKKGWQ